MPRKGFYPKNGRKYPRKKVVVSIRPSIVNNRFHNFSSSFSGHSHLSCTHNEANVRLLSVNKGLRKNNKSLALAYQELKIQSRVKDDLVLNLMDEKSQVQEKLVFVEHAAKYKVQNIRCSLEKVCRMFQEQLLLIQEGLAACREDDDLYLQPGSADNSVPEFCSFSNPKLNSGDQNNIDDDVETTCASNSNVVRFNLEKNDESSVSAMENGGENLLENQCEATPFGLSFINEEHSTSLDEANTEEKTEEAKACNYDQSFVTKRNMSKSNAKNLMSPFISESPEKLEESPINICQEQFAEDPIDYKIFHSKAKKESEEMPVEEQSELQTSAYNLSKLEETNLMVEEPKKVKRTRRKRAKKKNADECEDTKNKTRKTSRKVLGDRQEVADENPKKCPSTPKLPFVKAEVSSPLADTSWHNIENFADNEVPLIFEQSRKLLDDSLKENFSHTKMAIKEEFNESDWMPATNSRRQPSRGAKPTVLKEISLQKKMRR